MKKIIKNVFRKMGYELTPYSINWSAAARLAKLLEHHEINLILDVGANTGQYATGVRNLGYLGDMVSFEPQPSEYHELEDHAKTDENWTVFNAALGDSTGRLTMHVTENSLSTSFLAPNHRHRDAAPNSHVVSSCEVNVQTLDSVFRDRWVALNVLLKIDTQGYEDKVITGARHTLRHIKLVQMELSLSELYGGAPSYQAMIEQMSLLNFDLIGVEPGFCDPTSGAMLQFDGFFLNRVPSEPSASAASNQDV